MQVRLGTSLAAAAALLAVALVGRTVVVDDDVDEVLWAEDFDDASGRVEIAGHTLPISALPEGNGGEGGAYRIDYPFPPPNRFTGEGIKLQVDFADLGIEPQEEVSLRYSFYVPADHVFHHGGKLPGLSGAAEGTAAPSEGGAYVETAWSGRLLFLNEDEPPYGDGGDPPGRVATYLYVKHAAGIDIEGNRNPDNGRIFGITVPFTGPDGAELAIPKGRWSTIELHYRMNTPGQDDGVFEGWLNGVRGIRLTDVQYRTDRSPDMAVDRLSLTSFYGGPFANDRAETAYLDEIRILRPA